MTIIGANSEVAVPKRHSIFRFEIPQPRLGVHKEDGGVDTGGAELEADKNSEANADLYVEADFATVKPFLFELHGSQFESRATDRATKKFKQRRMDEL